MTLNIKQVSRMAADIIKILDTKYPSDSDKTDDYIDVKQIKDMCKKITANTNSSSKTESDIDSLSLGDLKFETPDFVKQSKTKSKTSTTEPNPLTTETFRKKYDYFIQIIYTALKLDIEIFDPQTVTLKNNYHILKSITRKKRKYIQVHFAKLKLQYKNPNAKIAEDYYTFLENYGKRLKILENLLKSIKDIIDNSILDTMDNLLQLVIPYFYKNIKYIEEYNAGI